MLAELAEGFDLFGLVVATLAAFPEDCELHFFLPDLPEQKLELGVVQSAFEPLLANCRQQVRHSLSSVIQVSSSCVRREVSLAGESG